MNEKQVSGRKLAVSLGLLVVLLAAALAGTFLYYTSITKNKDTELSTLNLQLTDATQQQNAQITDLQNQIANLTNQNNQLKSQNNQLETNNTNLQNQISSLNTQISSLKAQIETLKAAKLITIGLSVTDNRPLLQTPYVQISGYICNVGSYAAVNVSMHVVIYQGNVVAKDTYIEISSLSGEGSTNINSQVFYAGSAITNYNTALEYVSSTGGVFIPVS
jgi:uncharacterized protein (UPF0333 family)